MQGQLSGGGGGVRHTGCGVDGDAVIVWIDVGQRGGDGEVMIGGTGIGYGKV